MGKSGCFPSGGCRWVVEFKKSMNARMAKFRNDFRRKVFRDNKHLGNLGADQLHNETGTRDMEITKKTAKPATDSTVPKKKVVKKLTYDYQPSLYAGVENSENQRTTVVHESGFEHNRTSSQERRGSSGVKHKAIDSDPVTPRSMNEELDKFVNLVIRNSVVDLVRESNATYLARESTENLMMRHDSTVNTTGEHVVKDTDTIKDSTTVNLIKESTEIVLKEQADNFDAADGRVDIDTDNVSVTSSVLNAFAESAVKASLYELVVVENVNQSAIKARRRRIPKTVNDIIEMIGDPAYIDSSNLRLPDVDI